MSADPADLEDEIWTANVASRSGGFTDRVDAAQVRYDARVEDRDRRFVNTDGQVVDATTWIGLYADKGALTTTTRIWVPGADKTIADEARMPVRVFSAKELDGDDVWFEIFL